MTRATYSLDGQTWISAPIFRLPFRKDLRKHIRSLLTK